MHPILHRAFCYQAVVLAGLLAYPAPAAELMPPAQQNALVQRYCAVCHTDAAKNGGLSLQHFDAVQAPPSLVAMLLSKLTGGVSLSVVREMRTNTQAASLVDKNRKSGALGAAGIPTPDKATQEALIYAFAMQSTGATEWTVERSKDGTGQAPGLTVSLLREVPSTKNPGEAGVYRLIASCNAATHEGSVQLAWSPVAQSGTLVVSIDGQAAVPHRVQGSEKMGNGSGIVLQGLAALVLAESKRGVSRSRWSLPAESLTVSDLFPGETVTFPFATLPQDARQELSACFASADSSHRRASSESR